MNKSMFRLIFSKHLGMLVPAPENANSSVKGKSSGQAGRRGRRAVAAMLALASSHALMAAPLAGLVPGGGAWSGANSLQLNGNMATITQTMPKAILNWQQLNLGAGETLNFNQASSSWAALNRIHDINPSSILGTINAKGSIYLINQNGIVFGNGSQVNVGSLTASTLDVTDDLFNAGILSNTALPVFSGTGGYVWVEQGANIAAATGGRVMLLAPDVKNSGVITTPDGQTILAAGKQVYLKDSTDPAGLLVEVNSGGTATNLGDIVANRGNVTLVGLAVNQQGRISASTSVRANGSIHLLARDTIVVSATQELQAQRGGVVTIGKNSSTTINVETADKEEVLDAQVLNPSRVLISGGAINIDGSIVAHGGQVSAIAAPDSVPVSSSAVSTNRIVIGPDALIDVSGVIASAPMSRNQIKLQLFSDQLKDTPLLRGGPLFGETVYIDARKGTGALGIDIQPSLALTGKTIAERMASGGTVNLNSPEVILNRGSVIDVSGGGINYDAGFVKESHLYYQGTVVSISDAKANTPYQGLADTYSVTDAKWGVTRSWNLGTDKGTLYAGYSEGRDAGTLNITAVNSLLQVNLKATTSPGITQRQKLPDGGKLNLNLTAGLTGISPALRIVTQNISALPFAFSAVGAYDASVDKFNAGDTLPTALTDEIQLGTNLFNQGFNHLSVNAAGKIRDDAAITMPVKGSLSLLTTDRVDINANVLAAGGNVSISGGDTHIADGVTIRTAGLDTMDAPASASALSTPIVVDGGSIAVTGFSNGQNMLALGADTVFDASAGSWLNASGKLSGGKGGNISLTGISQLLPQSQQLRSYGYSKGGEFSLTTLGDVRLGGQDPHSGLWLADTFFNQGGFSKFTVTASGAGANLQVGDGNVIGSAINATALTLQSRNGVAVPTLLPAAQRTPVSFTLKADQNLTIAKNAVIQTDAPNNSASRSTVALEAKNGQLSIFGSLIAPAGNISANITSDTTVLSYDHTQSLFVSDSARLIASGYYAVPISSNGSLAGASVLSGGNITLSGGERAAVVLKQGSLLDVSGTSGQVDVATASGTTRQTQYGAAGSISISSPNTLALDGDFRAKAQGTGAGGTLTLSLSGTASTDLSKGYPLVPHILAVTQDKINLANGLNAGDALDSLVGLGQISAKQVADGGFGRLNLGVNFVGAENKITLPAALHLALPVSLTLDTPLLEVTGNGTAQVQAAYVALTNSLQTASASAPLLGNGKLEVIADFIDLINPLTVTGVNSTLLSARQDIRGRGQALGGGIAGSLTTPGELDLSARQIYPVTNSAFTFEATGASSKINIASSGLALKPVLSAGGQLTLKANDIVQGGALLAPLGSISLEAANSLTLKSGSLTSVSAKGQLIPYGVTGLGGLILQAPGSDLTVHSDAVSLKALPEKRIQLTSAKVDTQSGAKVDISGGGDILAYEFIQGIGGTRDVLGQPGVYAVIPSSVGEYAPFDFNYNQTIDPANPSATLPNSLKLGDAVYLSAAPGLAAGMYTLLPARYALLPGAFLVEPLGGPALALNQSLAQVSGSTLVSGYGTVINGVSRDAKYSTFQVTSGDIFRPAAGTFSHAPAEYRLTTGDKFFSKLALNNGSTIPRLAADAGQLSINAGNSLILDAQVLTDKSATARGALVDIVSDKISVVSAVGSDDGTLQLTAASLGALNAESLLLGGTRSQADDGGVNIITGASSLTFANDAEHALQVTELIAAATDTLTVNAGASIQTRQGIQPAGSSTVHASGDGALLAVSALHDFNYDRSNVSPIPATGTLDIASGASLGAGRSLVLDATKNATLAGNVQANSGGSATLGANRILLGNGGAVTGLQLNDSLVASLGDLAKITLNSYSSLDIYSPVTFGNANLDLTINSGGIAGHLNAGETANLLARNLIVKNSAGAVFDAVGNVAGTTLNLSAENITFEGNRGANAVASQTTIAGFSDTHLNANAELGFNGVGQTQLQTDHTTLTSTRITAATATDFGLTATGSLTTARAAQPEPLAAAGGLGTKLNLTAASVALGGNVELPSGQFTAHATQGNVDVASGASIKAASVPVQFDRYTAYTPGGMVTLQSDLGNVSQQAGSTIDVSGAATADAGTLKVAAQQGMVNLAGTLNGQAGADRKAGNFVSDSRQLADFSGLNTTLNNGGFTNSRDLRVRSGDVQIAATDVVKAHQFTLSADAGNINVAGTIDASGPKAGAIGLYAGQSVTLNNTARLLATASKDGEKGGRVEAATRSGVLDFQAGSKIDVSSGAGGAGGEIHLRAPRNTANTDLNITELAGALTGASGIQAEGFRTYNASSITASTIASPYFSEAASFLASALVNNGVGLRRLGKLGDLVFTIAPGVEIDNASGNLTLPADWTLHDWRFDPVTGAAVTNADLLASGLNANGAPLLAGVLSLRAADNLALNGTLSDGFGSAALTGINTAQGLASWSYNLVGGADFNAANYLSTVKAANNATGNVTLANNRGIRTGTGDIRIAAGGNLTLGNDASVIYTTGHRAADLSGFTLPANASYLADGGDIDIHVQGDINGKIATGAQQLISNWLFRQGGGSGNKNVSWWLRPDLFKQGVAAFGGGNVAITADGNITNFSASVPTTARYTNDGSGTFSIDGGGDITVKAGNDILSGIYYAGRGNISLSAGGQIAAAANTFGTTLALQDASAQVSAVRNALIETVFNPTLMAQVFTTSTNPLLSSSSNASALNSTGNNAYFLTYGKDSAIKLDSLTGNAALGPSDPSRIVSRLAVASSSTVGINNRSLGEALTINPGTVSATAFSGDINAGRLTLAPAANGNLTLLAAGNVSGNDPTATIAVSDADINQLPSVVKPTSQTGGFGNTVFKQIKTGHAATPVHAADTEPVTIVARDGSITGSTPTIGLDLTSPKAVYIHAGRDVTLNVSVQNLKQGDISVVEAGRDFIAPLAPTSGVTVAGPGELLVNAGRNISLGQSQGIVTIANTVNSALPADGASITVAAGLGSNGANLDDYIATYINPTGTGPSVLQANASGLAEYRRQTAQALTSYIRKLTGNNSLSDADALARFLTLDKDHQAIFAYRHFSSELLASGKGFAVSRNHNRGDTAIATLFPTANQYNGDVALFNSQLRTSRNASIDILAPGGIINAGVPTSAGANIGIVTEHGGDIRAFAERGFQVEQSRVITQFGSDITVWVNNGDIDAGRGSKTALSVPERVVSTDADGNTTIAVNGVAAGSGIRAQTYDADGPAGPLQAPPLGSVALIAPRGILNASEAGIAAGNFLAVAQQVLGASNIQVSGTSTGVPLADTGSLAGSLAGVTNAASAATKGVTDDVVKQVQPTPSLNTKNFLPAFISVEVIGLGE